MSDLTIDHAGQPAPPAPSTAAQRGGTSTGAAAAGVSAALERTLPGPSRRVLLEVRVAEGLQDVGAAAHAAVAGFSGFHAETSYRPASLTADQAARAGAHHELLMIAGRVAEAFARDLEQQPNVTRAWFEMPARAAGAASAAVAGPIRLEGKRVVLLLQGGGALGAYQVGAHDALAAACEQAATKIAWVGGISIGAINAAVIAAPKGGDARQELEALWKDLVSWPAIPPLDWTRAWRFIAPWSRWCPMARLAPRWWNWGWMAFNPFGQRNFFSSRLWPLRNPWLTQWRRPLEPDELAFYPTKPLEKTLDRHVAWETLGDRPSSGCRLSLGAARVTTGDVVFFDSSTPHRKIGARHVLASGALPPAFPPVRVKDPVVDEEVSEDDALYWDGGVSSNTPIEWIAQELLEDHDERDTIVFLIDVWDRKGPVPKTMDEACWRQKSIQYGSRKDAAEAVIHDYRLLMQAGHADAKKLEICHVLYERSDGDPQFAFSDADFSRETYRHLRAQGAHDMAAALREPDVVPVAPLIYEDSVVLYRYGTEHKHRDTDGAPGRRPRRSRQVRLHCAGEQDDGPLASQRD